MAYLMAELKHVFIKPFVRRSPLHPTRKHLRSDYKLLQWRLQMSWAQHQPGDKCRGGHRGTVPWPSHHWDINIKISWQEVGINALLPGHQFFHSWILNCEVGDSILGAKPHNYFLSITPNYSVQMYDAFSSNWKLCKYKNKDIIQRPAELSRVENDCDCQVLAPNDLY